MLSFVIKSHIPFRLFSLTALISFGIASIIGSNDGTPFGSSTSNPNYVVFLADKDTNEKKELYAHSLQTGTVTKLNDPLVSGGNVTSYSISPDGAWVAYVADQEIDDRFELYIAKADGSTVVKVSSPSVNTDSDVNDDPLWAPDSSRIAYRSNESTRGSTVFVLRTVRPDGSGNIIVNPVGVTGSSVEEMSFTWAPDASRIAYLADQSTLGAIELYTSSAASAADNAKVNGSLESYGNVTEYAWAPSSSLIAYRADQIQDEVFELWVSTPTGGNNIRLNGNFLDNNREVQALSLVWAPNSSRIAYISNETTQNFRLYTVLPSGTGRLQVSKSATPANSNVIGIPSWSPTGDYLAYVGDLNVDQQFELYVSVPTTATSGNKVNGTLQGGNVKTGPDLGSPPAWAPDGSGIAYIAQQGSFGMEEVYVGAANGTNVKVSSTPTMATEASLGPASEVWAFDGGRLLYKSNQRDGTTQDLFTTLASGNTNVARITRDPIQADSLRGYGKWAPDGSYIAYVSEQDTAAVDELYINTPTGGNNRKISGDLVSGGNVDSEWFDWAP
jgi:Tol biopolymer transport system component